MIRLKGQEEELARLAAEGDRQAFYRLVTSYQTRVYSTCYQALGNREEAEDAAQEVFLQVYRSLASYRLESSFATWMHRIALNKCMDVRRKRMRRAEIAPMVPLEEDSPQESDPSSPEQLFIQEETRLETRAALQKLPKKYQEVVQLFYLEQLSYQEISERLEIEVKSVATRLYRAKLMMQEQFRKEGTEHDRISHRTSSSGLFGESVVRSAT